MYLSQSNNHSVSNKKTYEDSCLEEFDNYLNKQTTSAHHLPTNSSTSNLNILQNNINLINLPEKANALNNEAILNGENKPSMATLKYEEMKKKLTSHDKETADFLNYLDNFQKENVSFEQCYDAIKETLCE